MKRRFDRLTWIIVAILGIGLVVVVNTAPVRGQRAPKSLAEGESAPPIQLPSLDGKPASLAKLRGNVVVVDFWATWCPECQKSLPHLQKMQEDADLAKRGLRILAVDAHEGRDPVEKYIRAHKFTFPVLLDQRVTQRNWGVDSLPRTFLIGRDGRIRKIYSGFDDATSKAMDQAIDEALAEPGKGK